MAIIRKRNFSSRDDLSTNIDLIDTPEKLMMFAQRNDVNIDPCLDLESLVSALGIKLRYECLDDKKSGALFRDDESTQWIILVEKRHHKNRQRYTIAHELAHYCQHRHLKKRFDDKIFFRGGKVSPEEHQANNFASQILMPEYKLKELVASGVSDVEELSKYFQVSTLALRLRAKSLGYSGHGL